MPTRLAGQRQNLFAFVTMGVAMPIGFLLAGQMGQFFQLDDSMKANYRGFFFIAAAVMAVLLVVFWFSARLPRPAAENIGPSPRGEPSSASESPNEPHKP